MFMGFSIFVIDKICPCPSAARRRLSKSSTRVQPQSAGRSRAISLQVLSDSKAKNFRSVPDFLSFESALHVAMCVKTRPIFQIVELNLRMQKA
jgi:hypothetical protein